MLPSCRSRFRNRARALVLAVVFVLLAITLCWPGWYDNYHVVIPGELYRSAQMSASRLREHMAQDRDSHGDQLAAGDERVMARAGATGLQDGWRGPYRLPTGG